MQDFDPDTIPHGSFFVHKGYRQAIPSWGFTSSEETDFTNSDETANSPYVLDAINEIDRLLLVNGKRRGISSYKKFYQFMQARERDFPFYDYKLYEAKENAMMVRVSECKSLVASVFPSSIRIEKSEVFLDQKITSERSLEAEFRIAEGKFTYLEWPPLESGYIERGPYFLTLDDRGTLRIHDVKERTEEIVLSKGFYRCATFSLGGRYIYAINDEQEICKIDFRHSKILMKRKVEGLSDPENVISSHIRQVTPAIFAIGSVVKSEGEEKMKPCVHVVRGDLSDPNEEELKIKFFEMPSLKPFDPKQKAIFRSLYIKERELLLFGHTKSQKILVLNFGFDGSITETQGLSLIYTTLRGIALVREEKPFPGQKKEDELIYQKKKLKLPKPPSFLILDSKGDMHVFQYHNTRYSAPVLSMFIRPLSIEEFKKKENGLRETLKRKKKIRSKSHYKKTGGMDFGQEKKRAKSEVKMTDSDSASKIKITSEARKKKNHSKKETSPVESTTSINDLFKKTENPFLSIQNPEKTLSSSLFSNASGSLFKAAENPFLSVLKTEDKSGMPATSGLFSSSGNSLFGVSSSSKPSFTFQKLAPKESSTEEESRSSLFSLTKKSSLLTQHPGLDPANLLSANAPEKTFLKVFTTTEDPTKKKAFLFLNKTESDVLFKVENQEFPAHKYILSEKCKFFKNMFSSGMLESYSSMIAIPETKASIFKAFLEYVYLGQTVLNEDLALNLMDLSERYIIGDLKAFCENCLHNYLSIDNCVRVFESACLYDAPSLKQKTIFFFQINYKKILEKYELENLPKMSHLYLLKTYSKYNPILGPALSDLIVNKTFPSQSSFL